MTTLNKYASEICRKYDVHACTDVTGFSFLGHLHEMLDGKLNCCIDASEVPVIEEAHRHANEFLLTAAGQRNRNHTGPFVEFRNIPFSMEEILFDPQTSGAFWLQLKPNRPRHWKLNYKMQAFRRRLSEHCWKRIVRRLK